MTKLLNVASAALGLACRGAVPLLGVAILLGISSGHQPGAPGDFRRPGPEEALARDEDGRVCVTLPAPQGEGNTRCIVRDPRGKELMQIRYSRNGSLDFNLTASPTIRVAGYRSACGEFGFGVGGDGLDFEYTGRPGQSPVVMLDSRKPRRQVWYRVTPEGDLCLDSGAPAR